MGKFRSTMAKRIAQAARAFEKRRTDNHLPKSVAVRPPRTIGQRIARAARAFEKRQTKHGRKWVAVLTNEDTIVIALHGPLTAPEKALAQSPAGAAQVREFHRRMFTDASAVLRRENHRDGSARRDSGNRAEDRSRGANLYDRHGRG